MRYVRTYAHTNPHSMVKSLSGKLIFERNIRTKKELTHTRNKAIFCKYYYEFKYTTYIPIRSTSLGIDIVLLLQCLKMMVETTMSNGEREQFMFHGRSFERKWNFSRSSFSSSSSSSSLAFQEAADTATNEIQLYHLRYKIAKYTHTHAHAGRHTVQYVNGVFSSLVCIMKKKARYTH